MTCSLSPPCPHSGWQMIVSRDPFVRLSVVVVIVVRSMCVWTGAAPTFPVPLPPLLLTLYLCAGGWSIERGGAGRPRPQTQKQGLHPHCQPTHALSLEWKPFSLRGGRGRGWRGGGDGSAFLPHAAHAVLCAYVSPSATSTHHTPGSSAGRRGHAVRQSGCHHFAQIWENHFTSHPQFPETEKKWGFLPAFSELPT